IDDKGGIYVSGSFESPAIDLGNGPLQCAGLHDLYLAKVDADGAVLWSKRYGDAQDQIDLHLRPDPSGGVIATGGYKGSIDFGRGPSRRPYTATFIVAPTDAEGRARWSKVFGHRNDFAGTDSAVDGRNHVFVSAGSDGIGEFVKGGHPS